MSSGGEPPRKFWSGGAGLEATLAMGLLAGRAGPAAASPIPAAR